MRAFIAGLLISLAGQAGATPIAEIICEATPDMLERLEGRMQSSRAAIGMRDAEQLMEVWKDPRGDWVLVSTYATGTSCIVAMGQDWQSFEAVGEDLG